MNLYRKELGSSLVGEHSQLQTFRDVHAQSTCSTPIIVSHADDTNPIPTILTLANEMELDDELIFHNSMGHCEEALVVDNMKKASSSGGWVIIQVLVVLINFFMFLLVFNVF